MLGARVEALEASRAESDELINTLSAEEFSKFAASDVADALKFVAGVNVVEGQFAIIRGLEDRYSSTLYNSAPIPSPDPDRQSVQLDLFASDIVSNLVVAKTFGPDLPEQFLRRLDQHPHARLPRGDRGEAPGRAAASTRTRSRASSPSTRARRSATRRTASTPSRATSPARSAGVRAVRARAPLQGRRRPRDRLRHGGGLPGGARAAQTEFFARAPTRRSRAREPAFGELQLTEATSTRP